VHGVMLVFDVSNRKSFKHVSYWLSNISKHANENVQVQLVGNKVDLRLETKKDPNGGKMPKFIRKSTKMADPLPDEAEQDPFVQTYEGNNVANK
jgi:GTPase SAR1 family protein